MKFLRNILLFATTTAIVVNAQTATSPTLADAQKAYVAGNWKEAASAYEKVCPAQPAETQVSCNLWGILALSQIGDAKSFKTAGTKLDSLINSTNPQHANYADLVMTKAQFMLYLGKYDKAAENLIHAIETSRSNHNLVLQKVCSAVLSRTNNQDLSERCEELKKADTQESAKPVATPEKTVPAPEKVVQSEQKSPEEKAAETTPREGGSEAKTVEETPVTPAPQQATPVAQEQKPDAPQAKPAEEFWVLQLGAFGNKSNATLLVSNLKKQKIQSTIVESPRGERILYIVQTGHFATKEAATAYGEKALVPLKVEYQPILKK